MIVFVMPLIAVASVCFLYCFLSFLIFEHRVNTTSRTGGIFSATSGGLVVSPYSGVSMWLMSCIGRKNSRWDRDPP